MPENMTSIEVILVTFAIAKPFIAVLCFTLDNSTRVMNATINTGVRRKLGKIVWWLYYS